MYAVIRENPADLSCHQLRDNLSYESACQEVYDDYAACCKHYGLNVEQTFFTIKDQGYLLDPTDENWQWTILKV